MDLQLHGKTALSIELAKKINGEIISADSMQIYKKMDIGSAKPTKEEMQGIHHYLLDFIEPDKRYSVADYRKDVKIAINEIINKNKIPIIVGGTGLYINSIIDEIEYSNIDIDMEYRKFLEGRADNGELEELYKEAKKIDPEAIEKISPNDKKRILRILEIYHDTGKTKTQQEAESKKKEKEYDYIVFAINMPREILYERINKRVDIMIQNGLIEEVEDLLNSYKNFPTAMQALGYKEVKEYIDGELTKEEMIEKIKQETRRYAKRQITWFKRNKQTIWIDGTNEMQNNIKIILEEIG